MVKGLNIPKEKITEKVIYAQRDLSYLTDIIQAAKQIEPLTQLSESSE